VIYFNTNKTRKLLFYGTIHAVKMYKLIVAVSLLLSIYLYLTYSLFFYDPKQPEYPALRNRIGTILSHSSDSGGVAHTYCYYPKSSADFNSQNEYLLMRVSTLSECQNWFGASVFYEGPWVSEIEKLWWNSSPSSG